MILLGFILNGNSVSGISRMIRWPVIKIDLCLMVFQGVTLAICCFLLLFRKKQRFLNAILTLYANRSKLSLENCYSNLQIWGIKTTAWHLAIP